MLNFGGANHWIEHLTFVCQSCALDLQPRQLPSATWMIKGTSNAQGNILPSNDVQGSYCESKRISNKSALWNVFALNDIKRVKHTAQNRQHSSPILQEAQHYWSFQLPLGQTLYGGLLLAWAHLSTSTVPFDIPGPSRGSRQTHNLDNLMRFNITPGLTSHRLPQLCTIILAPGCNFTLTGPFAHDHLSTATGTRSKAWPLEESKPRTVQSKSI